MLYAGCVQLCDRNQRPLGRVAPDSKDGIDFLPRPCAKDAIIIHEKRPTSRARAAARTAFGVNELVPIILLITDAEKEVGPGDTFLFPQNSVHQEEAIEDTVIIEASTPFLNDRVRVEEDYGQEISGGLPTTSEKDIIEL